MLNSKWRAGLVLFVLLLSFALVGSNITQPPVITGINSGTDSPLKTAFGSMIAGNIAGGITTQFLVPGAGASAAFFQIPIAISGYVRNLSLYLTATAADGSVGRVAHLPNSGLGTNAPARSHSLGVFSGELQGSYTDTSGFARLERGDYYNVRSFREGVTVTSTFGGWSSEFVPDGPIGPLIGRLNATIPAATTDYLSLVGTTTANPTEVLRGLPISFDQTLLSFCVVTTTAQNAGGSLVLTVRKSGAGTALTITIAATAAAGLYCNTVNAVAFTGGVDWTTLEAVNNAGGGVSASIAGWSVGHAPASGNKWMVCTPVQLVEGAGSTDYQALQAGGGSHGATEVNFTTPFPITAATVGDLYVYVGAVGGGGTSTVLTVRKNLAASAVTATVPAAVSGIVAGAGSVGLAQGNSASLELVQVGAGGAFISGACFSIAKP